MSIVDSEGVRVYPEPKVAPVATVCDPMIRLRNRRWLQLKRLWKLSNRKTAEFLSQPYRTVDEAIRSAIEEEQDERDRQSLGYEPSPVVHVATGLTQDQVDGLRETYLADTELGDDPEVRDFFRKLAIPQATRTQLDADRRTRRARRERRTLTAGAV